MNTRFLRQIMSFVLCGLILLIYSVASAANIDPDDDGSQYPYGENVGWLNFEPQQGGGVTVSDTELTGYVWAENIGWINLNPANGGVVNDGNGNLSGYAWAENVGWINFAPTGSGVIIDPATGGFSGYGWGENIGWINFAPTGGGVKTAWRSAGGGGAAPTITGGDGCLIATVANGSRMENKSMALILLFGSGLIGLAGFRRKFRK